jgi:hypothetical protein
MVQELDEGAWSSTPRARPTASCRSAVSIELDRSRQAKSCSAKTMAAKIVGPGSTQPPLARGGIRSASAAQTIDWDVSGAPAADNAMRLFRWRNIANTGRDSRRSLVHLFTAVHFVLGALGPTRAIASGGLRHWNNGATCVMMRSDCAKTATHPRSL